MALHRKVPGENEYFADGAGKSSIGKSGSWKARSPRRRPRCIRKPAARRAAAPIFARSDSSRRAAGLRSEVLDRKERIMESAVAQGASAVHQKARRPARRRAHLREIRQLEASGGPAQLEQALDALWAQPRNAQECLPVGGLKLYREALRMGESPRELRVSREREVSIPAIDDLDRGEAVAPEEVVRLVEPVLPQERNLRLAFERSVFDRTERREVGMVDRLFAPERVGPGEQVPVRLLAHSDDELSRRSGRGRRPRRTRISRQAAPAGEPGRVPDAPEQLDTVLESLLGRDPIERRLTRSFEVVRDPIAEKREPLDLGRF